MSSMNISLRRLFRGQNYVRANLRRGLSFLLTFFALIISALFPMRDVRAQAGVELENVQASVRFGEAITFVATVKLAAPLQSSTIMISDELQGLTWTEPVTVQPDGRTEFYFDTKQHALRPFTNVRWSYQFTFSDGSTAQSTFFFVRYTDDRFDWQVREAGPLRINWYAGDASFGQAALDAAQAGLDAIGRIMSPDLTRPVEFFIYANTEDLRQTLAREAELWVAGHADPALGVVMLAIEPGSEQGMAMEQRIPHELMHVMLYRQTGPGYPNLPAWLREGMATLAEVYPNTDYDRALAEAVAADNLIPLPDLCGPFPTDTGQAFLAYAEARSFIGYLHDTYGSSKLLELAAAYADGLDCERGAERTFGVSLPKLEMDWRASLPGQRRLLPALQNISPYLVLLCLVLIIPLVGMAGTLRKKASRKEPETYVRK